MISWANSTGFYAPLGFCAPLDFCAPPCIDLEILQSQAIIVSYILPRDFQPQILYHKTYLPKTFRPPTCRSYPSSAVSVYNPYTLNQSKLICSTKIQFILISSAKSQCGLNSIIPNLYTLNRSKSNCSTTFQTALVSNMNKGCVLSQITLDLGGVAFILLGDPL